MAIDLNESFSLMINEEDHLRIQVMKSGLDLKGAWEEINRIDDLIEKHVTFAFHEDITISRALKVNQSGYLPTAGRKYAYLGAWQAGYGPVKFDAWSGKTFEVVMFEGTRAECKRFIEHAIDSAIAHPERSVTVTGDGGRVTVQSDGGGRYSLRLDHLGAEA